MAFVNTPKLALPSSAVKGDGAGSWVTQWNQLCDNVEARLAKSGTDSPVGVVAGEFIGQQYYRTDAPERWYCTAAGIAGTAQWSATASFVGEVNVNGLLRPNQGVSVTGGNITLQAAARLAGQDAETWLRQASSGAEMNPFVHQARHRPGETNGVWTTPNDFMPFSIQQIQHSTTRIGGTTISTATLDSQTFGAAGAAKCSITINTTGRPGVSRGLLFGVFGAVVTTNGPRGLDVGVYRAVTAGTVGAIGTLIGPLISTIRLGHDGGNPNEHYTWMHYIENLPVSSTLQFAIHAANVDTQVNCNYVQLTYIDLGVV
jgi:hypothetical protein